MIPNSKNGGVDSSGSTERPPYVGLGHEMGHSEGIDNGTQVFDMPKREGNSVDRENQIRSEHGLKIRPAY